MQLYCQSLLNFSSLNLDLKNVFLGNYLTKNSKTQNKLRVSHLLIIDNKETAGVTLPSLQLTTL